MAHTGTNHLLSVSPVRPLQIRRAHWRQITLYPMESIGLRLIGRCERPQQYPRDNTGPSLARVLAKASPPKNRPEGSARSWAPQFPEVSLIGSLSDRVERESSFSLVRDSNRARPPVHSYLGDCNTSHGGSGSNNVGPFIRVWRVLSPRR